MSLTWKLEERKLGDLKPYKKNPRTLNKNQFTHIKESIDKFGLIDRIIINLDNTIIGGHQRRTILVKDNILTCDCWVPSRMLTDKEMEELNIRLNGNHGSFDDDILANLYEMDDLMQWGLDRLEKEEKISNKKYSIKLDFSSEDDLNDIRDDIGELAMRANAKMKVKCG